MKPAYGCIKENGTVIDVEIISHTLTYKGRRAELVLARDVTAQGLRPSQQDGLLEIFWKDESAD